MNALSDYFRIVMYPIMALLCLYAISYFPRLRGMFLALTLFFLVFGVGLLVLSIGMADANTWLRTWVIPVAQILFTITLTRSMWLTNKSRKDTT